MKFTKRQRENIAKALFDISKLIVAILVLGPVVSLEKFRAGLVIFGLIIFTIVFALAVSSDKGE